MVAAIRSQVRRLARPSRAATSSLETPASSWRRQKVLRRTRGLMSSPSNPTACSASRTIFPRLASVIGLPSSVSVNRRSPAIGSAARRSSHRCRIGRVKSGTLTVRASRAPCAGMESAGCRWSSIRCGRAAALPSAAVRSVARNRATIARPRNWARSSLACGCTCSCNRASSLASRKSGIGSPSGQCPSLTNSSASAGQEVSPGPNSMRRVMTFASYAPS